MLYETGLLKAQVFVGLPSGIGSVYLRGFGLTNASVYLDFRHRLYLRM